MGNPFKTPKFRALFKKWNNILEETGHEEIENFSLPEPTLIQWEASRWSGDHARTDPLVCESIQQYYEMAEALLETYEFKNKLQRRIWALHSAGVSARKIEKMLGRKSPKKTTIYSIIATIEIASGLKRG